MSEHREKSQPFDSVAEVSLAVGIILERRAVSHAWIDHSWRAVALMVGAPPLDSEKAWKEVDRGEGWVRFHCATLPVTLHRKETEAYRTNLTNQNPVLYVVLRNTEDPDAPHEIEAVSATASPFEAQDFLDSGDDLVEPVPLPPGMIAWLQAFVDAHHDDVPFKKRKRDKLKTEVQRFGKELHPIERRFYDKRKRQ